MQDPLEDRILKAVSRCPLNLDEIQFDLRCARFSACVDDVWVTILRLFKQRRLLEVLLDHPDGPFYALPGYEQDSLVIEDDEKADAFQARNYAAYFKGALE